MIVDLDTISENMKRIRSKLSNPKQIVPPAPLPTKTVDDEVEDELDEPHYKHQAEDMKYIVKCYKYLRELGLVESQYQFSEQFLNKNKYYFGMILCEHRHPSIDSVHNLIRNISDLNECVNQNNPVNYFDTQTNETPQAKWQCRRADVGIVTKKVYLDRLYEESQSMITKRLLRYF